MAHTPGPWRFAKDGHEPYWNVDMPLPGLPGYGYANAMVYTTEADARLIAAAPELLHELQHLLSMWEESIGWEPDYMDMADSARKAIAKAEGRSP